MGLNLLSGVIGLGLSSLVIVPWGLFIVSTVYRGSSLARLFERWAGSSSGGA